MPWAIEEVINTAGHLKVIPAARHPCASRAPRAPAQLQCCWVAPAMRALAKWRGNWGKERRHAPAATTKRAYVRGLGIE